MLEIGRTTDEDDEGYRLTLRPEWKSCLDLDSWGTHTGAPSFQGGESPEEVCVLGEASGQPDQEIDPWAVG